jgi:Domain of unknown function (DUF4157)
MSWWFSRSKSEEAEADIDAPPSPEATPGHTVEDRLLTLQRSAGNKSVQRMVAKTSSETADTSLPVPTRSGGEALPEGTRELMESRFGESFDDVRIHADEEAAASAVALGANAYTTERDIYFGRGKYAPKSPEGERLLAHELTHVIQQEGTVGRPAFSDELSNRTDVAEREAEAVDDAMRRGERIPKIVSIGTGIQRDVGWAQRGPLPDPYGTLLLLNAFAAKFLEAAKLIYKNPAAMNLVNEAEAAGIQFGGYAEDGPAKDAWAYTIGNTVYVPKARTDAVVAMSDFLFELNNALRAPKFAAIDTEATKGSKGSLSAKDYAYKTVELEVEGMLRLGEIWFEMKKGGPKGGEWDKYDADFFLSEYKAFKDGKKTKDDMIKNVLKRVYSSGKDKGKSVEQFYMEEYKSLSGGK